MKKYGILVLAIILSSCQSKINKDVETTEVKKGELLAIIGSSGYLEISVNMDSAARIVDRGSEVVCYCN